MWTHGTGDPYHVSPVGTPAPDFTLHRTPDETVSLRDFRGQPAVLVFYPADWSPVCGDRLTLYNEILPEFRRFRAAPLPRRDSLIQAVEPQGEIDLLPGRGSPQRYDSTMT